MLAAHFCAADFFFLFFLQNAHFYKKISYQMGTEKKINLYTIFKHNSRQETYLYLKFIYEKKIAQILSTFIYVVYSYQNIL